MKIKNLRFLFIRVWETKRVLYLISFINMLTRSVLPYISVVGVGLIINMLTGGSAPKDIFTFIIIFVSFNAAVDIAVNLSKSYLEFYDPVLNNRLSEFMSHAELFCNVEAVEDPFIKDMKFLFQINPSLFLQHLFNIFLYLAQIIIAMAIYAYCDTTLMLIIALTVSINVVITFVERRVDFSFNEKRKTPDRQLAYLFELMSKFKYAKEIRLNDANILIEKNIR